MINHYSGQYQEIAQLFFHSVREIASSQYSQEQVEAWAPAPIDFDKWYYRCEWKRPFVYLMNGEVAGFLELDHDGHIDCHYVHPQYTRRGIARALLRHVIALAQHQKVEKLFVEASHLIKPLYLQEGFQCIRLNHVSRNNVILENWIMERKAC